jgi:hypothetical protein
VKPTAIAALAALLAVVPVPAAGEPPLLVEITDAVKLDFVHDAGSSGSYHHPEIMTPGCAFLDYDADGDLDIYLVQAGRDAVKPAGEGKPNQLFRQEADGTFADVTAASGLGDTGYGMGVAVGDIDNDGLPDVFVSNYGPDRLYRNEGSGQFRDITSAAGIRGDHWSASATFCDYDADGFLDLYITHYVQYDPKRICRGLDGKPDYCSPQVFPGVSDSLYRNLGGGKFADVSRAAGITSVASPGLGVVCADWNDDGRQDLYVANDGQANQLWINDGKGKFTEDAFFQGLALNALGRPEAGMGVAVGDVDLDGDLDVFLTHLKDETNTLYLNQGAAGFEDSSASAGLGAPSLPMTGFGTAFFDLEHDGDLDLAVVNGRAVRVTPLPGAAGGPAWIPFAEPNVLLVNQGGGKFQDASSRTGTYGSLIETSRGLAVGDVDNDGDQDLLVAQAQGQARLFRNDAPKQGHWVQIRALEPATKRDAYGALVAVTSGGRRYVRVLQPGYSYQSSSDPRVHFGLPGDGRIETVAVRWPDGTWERFPGGAPDRLMVVRRGEGSTSDD